MLAPISLAPNDLMEIQASALKLGAAIDLQFVEGVVHDRDADWLARELFVRFGLDDPARLADAVSRTLALSFPKHKAERALSRQRKLESQPELEGIVVPAELLGVARSYAV